MWGLLFSDFWEPGMSCPPVSHRTVDKKMMTVQGAFPLRASVNRNCLKKGMTERK